MAVKCNPPYWAAPAFGIYLACHKSVYTQLAFVAMRPTAQTDYAARGGKYCRVLTTITYALFDWSGP